MYSCIRDFLFGFGSPVNAVCCSSKRRTTRSAWPRIRKSLAVSRLRKKVGRQIAAAVRTWRRSSSAAARRGRAPGVRCARQLRTTRERLCAASYRWRRSCARGVYSRWSLRFHVCVHLRRCARNKCSSSGLLLTGVTGRMSGASPAAPAFMSPLPRELPAR